MQIFIALLAILLTGCSMGSQSAPSIALKEGRLFQEDTVGYELSLPDVISESGSWTESGNSSSGPFFGSKLDTSIDPPFGRRAVGIKVHHLESSCSPSLTGASQTEPLTAANGKAGWGKVDLFDDLNFESGDGAYGPLRDVVCRNMPGSGLAAVYALCSEKDGKTVVICISQMTDNPEQAKEIFETFRWTRY